MNNGDVFIYKYIFFRETVLLVRIMIPVHG